GSSKIVLYSGSTTMVKTLEATAADLATGQEVVITGSENSDGTVTAQRIQLGVSLPQGAAPGSSTGTSAGGSPGAAGTGGTGAGAATSTTAAQ
ncbi:MAG: hypothetical protein H5T84_04735, partial [Thermoleophilia bacterium]|nr:hypothetical protein [Thermoleophilia bacterium]